MKTLFEKIINREIPSSIIYEDQEAICIKDINPIAKIHLLIIPKKPISRLSQSTNQDQKLLGHLLLLAQKIAKQQNINQTGYRIIINNGKDAGEEIPHLHLHLIGGEKLKPLN